MKSTDMTLRPRGEVVTVNELPHPRELPDGSILGMYSIHLPDTRRLIPFKWQKSYLGEIDTEPGHTRQWVKTLGRRRYNKAQLQGLDMTRPPLMVRPGIMSDAIYIDIKSAYPSIYKILGWGVEYLRGQYLAVGNPLIYPFPPTWKVGRSYVVTGSLPRGWTTFVKDRKAISVKKWNQNANPCMVSATYDILSMLGRFAQHCCGARYWNIDGGIMPARMEPRFMEFCESVGLQASVKAGGDAVIVSAGVWKIGDKYTARWGQGRAFSHTGDFIPMSADEAEFLYWKLENVQRFAR